MNTSSPTRSDTVLILTASTGAGHDSVAVALQQAMGSLAPGVRVQIVDALSGARGGGALSPGRWYDAMADHAPWLWCLIYRATNREWAVQLGMAAGALPWARRLRSIVLAERPAKVVSVHPVCTRLAAAVFRTLHGAPPLHCVVTDLVTIHRCWVCDAVDAFYVATPDACDALIRAGISPERIHLTGLPLRAAFAQAPGPPDEDAMTRVLLLGGGHPSRRLEQVARALVASGLPLRLIVVCGRNTRVRRHLTRVLGVHATVLGWCEDITTLMRWSSVIVTRGGPTTLAEALSQARPVLIFQALKDQETGNIALAERTDAGSHIPDVKGLVHAIAARPRIVPMSGTTHAAWWGGAALRVATRVLAERNTRSAAPSDKSPPRRRVGDPELAGREIHNPVSGERIVIRQSAAQTGGQLLSFDLFLPPGAHVPARHVHPNQEERFTVLEGQMRFRLGWRRTILAKSGDTIVVPPGSAHWFGNPGEGVAHARVEARPALRLQEVFERSAAMDMVERFPGARMPRFSELALFMIEFQRELAVPHVPAFLVKAFLAPLAWWGRRRREARLGAIR